jgi:hypothetical protein
MSMVVRDIVDNPSAYPGVHSAKAAASAEVSTRTESIVIYTLGQEWTDPVIQRLAEYQNRVPEAFLMAPPPMTDQVGPGIGVGDEPTRQQKRTLGGSFGAVRVEITTNSLYQSMSQGDTETQFIERTQRKLRSNGIDPNKPHRNLPVLGSQRQ